MKFSIITLGCKVNHHESEKLASELCARGHRPAAQGDAADICIVNSCTVTAVADAKTRQRIRQARSKNPSAVVCVIGCMPEVSREAVSAMEEVDLIIGSRDKERTVDILQEYIAEKRGNSLEKAPRPDDSNPSYVGARTRAFLKIEDGCDRFCAYCIIPYARGAVRSKARSAVISDIEGLLAKGYKEIVLTGINLALYGAEESTAASRSPLFELLKDVTALCEPAGCRIRLGSLEPNVMNGADFSAIAALPGICPQFHLSLQSGSDRTLLRMGRRYTSGEYAAIVRSLRDIDTHFAITADVIVGFPGETEADFAESLEFVKSMGFAKVHVFPYSVRKGTRAADMPDQIPSAVKKARASEMLSAAGESSRAFLADCKGKSRSTLIFGKDKQGLVRGLTDNGIDVRISPEALSEITAGRAFPRENDIIELTLSEKITCGFE